MSTWITEHIVQAVVTAIVSLTITLIVSYLTYRFKQRTIVSIGIFAETMVMGPLAEVVITNHGRSSVVVTDMIVYIPSEIIVPRIFGPDSSLSFKKQRYLTLRRLIKAPNYKNDNLADAAERVLSNGAVWVELLPPTESIKIGPGEKTARTVAGKCQVSNPFEMQVEPPNTYRLVPSCQLDRVKHRIWGPVAYVVRAETGDYNIGVMSQDF